MSEVGLPDWAKSANIYEVNIRQYTPEGTFKAFEEHLPRLKKMGVDILWLMPIYPISDTKKKGSLGSYYAVSDYKAVNPSFGKMAEFQSMIDEAHRLGMKIILDWVPNHTGWDHVWIKDHPEYYTQDKDGNIIDPHDSNGKSLGWADVADLNYGNRDMRHQMIQDMLFWVENYDVDGFRQDMAMLVPLDFWKEASESLRKAKPTIFLLAESEEMRHVNEGYFNAIYGWSSHHIINEIAVGRKKISELMDWYYHVRSNVHRGSYMHFTSNHDENSWSGSEIERMGEAHLAFAVLVNTFDGMPLTYSGQEEPVPNRLEFFEKDDIPFCHYRYADFYKKLNELRHRNEALWHGDSAAKPNIFMKNDHFIAYSKEKNQQQITVVINLSNQKRSLTTDFAFDGKDIFSKKAHHCKVGDLVTLGPWEYLVIEK